MLNEKRAKEGGNNCGCSQKPHKYKILNYPIRLYDTVGFGDEDKNVEDIRNFFKKLDEELLNSKEKIHLILYFIDGKAGNKFSKNEIILLKEEILKRNILIFYIVTKFDYNPNKNEKKYKIELKKIYKSLTSKVGKENLSPNDDENLKKFFGVNLVKKSSEKEIFGFDTIIKNIYSFFYKEAIILRVIKEKHINYEKKKEDYDWDDIYSILKDNFFFSHLQNYKEIEEKYEQESNNCLKNAKSKLSILGIIPIIDRISYYYINKSLKEDIEKSFKFKDNKDKELNDKEKNNSYNQIFIRNVKEVKTEPEKKSFDLFKIGAQFFNNPFFKISKNGEEMIKTNLEKFRERNYNITLSLIDSVLKGIEFFEKLSLSFDNNNN